MLSDSSRVSADLVSLPGQGKGPMLPYASPATLRQRSHVFVSLIAAVACIYLAYLGLVSVVLRFELLQGDAVVYWRESFQLAAPYSTWWVPGYPFLLAAVRVMTLNALHPATVMLLVSGAFYLVAVATVWMLANELKLKHPAKIAMLFAVFPFTGLNYSVWPIADITAMAFCLLCQLAFARRRWTSFVLCAAIAMMVHKTMWFFVPCMMMSAAIVHRESRRVLPWAFLPLITWIVAGAIHYGDPLWFLRWGVEHLVVSRSSLPVLDGLFGPFQTATPAAVLKALVILTIVSVAALVLYRSCRIGFWLGASIAATLIFLAVVMNQYEVWVVARFSKLLVLPVAVLASQTASWNRLLENSTVYALLVIGCVATNLGFGLYMVGFFSA